MGDAAMAQDGTASSSLRFAPGRVLVLGFGFLAISLTLSLYTSYIPLLLRHYVKQEAWVGAIMGLRYLFALTLQPYMVARSDRTWTRLGRRLPYLMVGMPAAAILFFAIPFSRTLLVLLILDILFNIAFTVCYGPTIALMPDITPSTARSKANSLINLMGGIGALISYLVLGRLQALSPHLPYLVAAVFLIAAPIIVSATVKEPKVAVAGQTTGFRHLFAALGEVTKNQDKSALFLLIAIFFWFIGENSVNVFFTSYGVYHMHISSSKAMMILGLFAVSFLIFAVPVGWLSSLWGRRRTILVGLVGLSAVFALMAFVHSSTVMIALMFLGGASWACVNVNSYPWVSDMTLTKVGAYTGLYYLSSGLADTIGQPIIGHIIDWAGFPSMFISAAVSCVVALVFIAMARTEHAPEGTP